MSEFWLDRWKLSSWFRFTSRPSHRLRFLSLSDELLVSHLVIPKFVSHLYQVLDLGVGLYQFGLPTCRCWTSFLCFKDHIRILTICVHADAKHCHTIAISYGQKTIACHNVNHLTNLGQLNHIRTTRTLSMIIPCKADAYHTNPKTNHLDACTTPSNLLFTLEFRCSTPSATVVQAASPAPAAAARSSRCARSRCAVAGAPPRRSHAAGSEALRVETVPKPMGKVSG